MIENFIFDLYGTLVDIHTDEEKDEAWEKLAVLYRENGAEYTAAELKDGYRRGIFEQTVRMQREFQEITCPEVSLKEVFLDFYKKHGVPADDTLAAATGAYFRKITTEYIRLYPGAREMLEKLKAKSRIWLLSNAQEIFTRPELDELGISELFDGIYISSECRCKKPGEEFYRSLLSEQNIDPLRAVMIGNDGKSDIMGAKSVGLNTIYIRSELSPEEPFPDADIILKKPDMELLSSVLTKL